MSAQDDMMSLDAMLQSLSTPAPATPVADVKKPEWGVQDKDGATIPFTDGDPVLTSTPEPTPIPHAPPAANVQSFQGSLEPKSTKPVSIESVPAVALQTGNAVLSPSAPMEQSALTSRVIPPVETPVAPVEKVNEPRIFLTGNSGVGKSFIAALLKQLKPHIVVVDGIDSARDFKSLQAAGFVNYHVVCSGMTLQNRPKRQNIQEPLEKLLNDSVKMALLKGGSNHMLHCVWNDPGRQPPSPRLLTVEQFLERLV